MRDDLQHEGAERLLRVLAEIEAPAAMEDRLMRRLRQAQAEQTSAGGASRWIVPATAGAGVILGVLGGVYRHVSMAPIEPQRSELASVSRRTGTDCGLQSTLAPYGESPRVPGSKRARPRLPSDSLPLASRAQPPESDERNSGRADQQTEAFTVVKFDPALSPGMAAPASALSGMGEVKPPGTSLPRFEGAANVGHPLPKIAEAITPGDKLPGFEVAAPPGRSLPSFAEATKNGDWI